MARQDTTIRNLQDRLKLAQAQAATDSGSGDTSTLQKQYASLQRKVHDMEVFHFESCDAADVAVDVLG